MFKRIRVRMPGNLWNSAKRELAKSSENEVGESVLGVSRLSMKIIFSIFGVRRRLRRFMRTSRGRPDEVDGGIQTTFVNSL